MHYRPRLYGQSHHRPITLVAQYQNFIRFVLVHHVNRRLRVALGRKTVHGMVIVTLRRVAWSRQVV